MLFDLLTTANRGSDETGEHQGNQHGKQEVQRVALIFFHCRYKVP